MTELEKSQQLSSDILKSTNALNEADATIANNSDNLSVAMGLLSIAEANLHDALSNADVEDITKGLDFLNIKQAKVDKLITDNADTIELISQVDPGIADMLKTIKLDTEAKTILDGLLNNGLPSLSLPSLSLPNLSLPDFSLPDLDIFGTLDSLGIAGLFGEDYSMDELEVPGFSFPDFSLPDFSLPDIDIFGALDSMGIASLFGEDYSAEEFELPEPPTLPKMDMESASNMFNDIIGGDDDGGSKPSDKNPNHWANFEQKPELNDAKSQPPLNSYYSDFEDLIAFTLQPKYKHSYVGEFDSKPQYARLERLNWLIKSMDRPKVDIEHVEQIRNNVKRYYPVKYNYGDLSITFWDDVHHDTIAKLTDHFENQIWDHEDVYEKGNILLRDKSIISEFVVYDLSMDGEAHLKYTFYNALLSSFDLDAPGDEEDGTFTVQAVFKIEKFTVETVENIDGILNASMHRRLGLPYKRN